MTIRFAPFSEAHVPDAAALAHQAYRNELRHVPALAADGVPDLLRDAIAGLVRDGTGVAALDGDHLVGYLAFFGPYPKFFGNGTGCFSPLHGSAVTGGDRARLTSLLFQHAAERMVDRSVDTFAITSWHHDDEVRDALASNGFGIRNADAIRMVDPPLETTPPPGIVYQDVPWEDAGSLLSLTNGLIRHLRQSPTFLASQEYTVESYAERLEERRTRHVVAFDGETPIGYVELCDDGENILTTAPDMCNICGAFLEAAYRGRGIYDGLLAFVLETLRTEGIRRVGVDFETMNPTALHFWTRYFDRYTTSLARRIDAR